MPTRVIWGAVTAVTAAAGLFGAVLAPSSEAMLRTSFAQALNAPQAAAPLRVASAPVAGTEDYWLSAMRDNGPAPLTKAVAIGDRITLSLGGQTKNLEVTSVSEFAPEITEVDTSDRSGRFVLVSARDKGKPDASIVRFVVELDPAVVHPRRHRAS